jgi:5'-3' exonuclease
MNLINDIEDVKKRVLVIDGSGLAHLHGNKANYKETIHEHLRTMLNKFYTNYFVIILEKSKTNFRHNIAVSKGYKENRIKSKETIKNYLPYLNDVFNYIREQLYPVTYLGVENDDILSIMAHSYPHVVICGNDVDLLAIPGTHYNIKTNETKVVTSLGKISYEENKLKATGLYNIYAKILKGSSKENYSGLIGYGPKKVYQLLKDCKTEEEMQRLCIDLFYTTYGPVEGKKKLEEGFRLCWLIQSNTSFKPPHIIDYGKIKKA